MGGDLDNMKYFLSKAFETVSWVLQEADTEMQLETRDARGGGV